MACSSQQAIKNFLAQHTNTPGMCQANVVKWFESHPVGDVNGDGDADAVDGWESEPKEYRHPGDYNFPAGAPLAFHGGSKGEGHRCMSLEHPGVLGSTDMSNNRWQAGVTSRVVAASNREAVALIEAAMGVTFTGWSETCDGEPVEGIFHPNPAKPHPKPQTRGARVDRALRNLRRALARTKNPVRRAAIKAAISALLRIKTHDRKN